MLIPVGQLAHQPIASFFTNPLQPLHLDLGTGLGHFICDMANAHPECNWLGLEYEYAIAERAAKRVAKNTNGNAQIVACDARLFLLEHIQPLQLQHLWINFPDPWPKERHQERRHTHPWMIDLMIDRLAGGGCLHLASDIPEYYQELNQTLIKQGFKTAAPAGWIRARLPFKTKYELKWLAAGKTLYFGDWQKPVTTHYSAAYRIQPQTPPTWHIPAQIPAPQILNDHAGHLLKVFRPRKAQKWHFLFADRMNGIETHGWVDLNEQNVEINGVWTTWKIALLNRLFNALQA